jgi:hypothetical protein
VLSGLRFHTIIVGSSTESPVLGQALTFNTGVYVYLGRNSKELIIVLCVLRSLQLFY